ncbi:hypothetical protein ABIE65_003341 [Constrictibacter sp. MBR-5]|uniref:phage late control D family protein n=1 Tax=Constrictibacter sp. MBR-5 TaxID=3156467 RepID=UPI003392761A
MPLLPSFFTVQVAFAPLPPPFMFALRQIEVECSIERASIFRLHFDLSRTMLGDWDLLQFDIFRPLVPIRISVAFGLGLPQTLINGYVRDVEVKNSNQPGASTLDVVGLDATATLMNHIQQPMTWPNLPDSEVVRTIFAKYAILPFVLPTPPLRTMVDVTTTQRVPDIRYVKQLAERNAYELYVQPDPLAGMDVGHFHPPQTVMPPQGVLSVDLGIETNLLDFNVSNDTLRPTSVAKASIDPLTKAPIPAIAPTPIEPPMGLEPTLARIIPPPISRPGPSDAASPAEVQVRAQAEVNAASRSVRGSGEVDSLKYGRPVRPGLPVLIRGAGRQHSGLYYVTEVTHTISEDGYSQNFQASRNAVGLTGAEIFVDPLAAIA